MNTAIIRFNDIHHLFIFFAAFSGVYNTYRVSTTVTNLEYLPYFSISNQLQKQNKISRIIGGNVTRRYLNQCGKCLCVCVFVMFFFRVIKVLFFSLFVTFLLKCCCCWCLLVLVVGFLFQIFLKYF